LEVQFVRTVSRKVKTDQDPTGKVLERGTVVVWKGAEGEVVVLPPLSAAGEVIVVECELELIRFWSMLKATLLTTISSSNQQPDL
jgi:hypothetical protein